IGLWPIPALILIGSAVSVAYALRLVGSTFLGPRHAAGAAQDPRPGLWAAPAVLAGITVLAGLMPMTLTGGLVDAATGAVTGAPVHARLALWHGAENAALWLSLAVIGGGLLLVGLQGRLDRARAALYWPDAARIFEAGLAGLTGAARHLDRMLHGGRLSRALGLMLITLLLTGWAAFRLGPHQPGTRALQPVGLVAVLAWAALIAACLALVRHHRQRLLALILAGVVGLIVSLGFAFLSAPDLALTQISVEVVTVVLMLLALKVLPRETPVEARLPRARDALLAGATGFAVAVLAYTLMTRDFAFPGISAYHLAHAKVPGGGANVVNVILVDFRGYDTFGEITVLGIAATLIFALASTLLSSGPVRDGSGNRSLLMVVATRAMLPLALMVAIFIFLRGHNMPGGGFIAGLVVSIALIMQYMASGLGWTEARLRIDHHGLIGAGLLIATATGTGSWLAGRPFMTSAFGHLRLWPLDEIELASATLFDLGVFLTVLGAVMLALASLSRIALRAGPGTAPDCDDRPGGRVR
ncbi:MAG: DUF4040 domain-containing protein, partial [Gemmobacter sp.]|nr:DUF4040 domain-containing protein [Gemmobacter sp.]